MCEQDHLDFILNPVSDAAADMVLSEPEYSDTLYHLR